MQVFPHLTEKEKVSFYHRVYIETNGLYQISFQPEGAAIQEAVLDFKINTKGLALYASLDLSRKTSETNNQILSDITRQISQIREELASLYVAQTQESISKQIQQLEKDIQHDDKMLASNYDKHIEDASFFTAYNKKKADLDQLLLDWEIVQEEIDNLD